MSSARQAGEVRVGIHQPHYLPWLRYFEKIARSDVFVMLDDVQYEKNGFQNRNKIKTAQGPATLTVPVQKPLQRPICEILIDNSTPWREKHLRSLEMSYRRAPHFERYWEGIQGLYSQSWETLAALNEAMLTLFAEQLGIATRIVKSRELGVESRSSTRLVELCQAVGGNTYLSGAHALSEYLDETAFHDAGIGLALQEWSAPEYPQLYPAAGFVKDLAIVDLLFNVGPQSLETLVNSGGLTKHSPSTVLSR